MRIESKYLSPTNLKQARIKVFDHKKQSKIFNWNYSLDTEDNHLNAINEFIRIYWAELLNTELHGDYTDKGFIFVINLIRTFI